MSVITRAARPSAPGVSWRERIADPCADPERLTVTEAFSLHAGINLMDMLPPEGPDRKRFAIKAIEMGVHLSADDTWGDIFSKVLTEKVEPYLGLGRPTILDEYPTEMSALARPKADDPRVAERFEVYLFASSPRAASASQRRDRTARGPDGGKDRIYHERYPIDEDFINALRTMPSACGVALGLDRLVMLMTGAPNIEHVMWTPVAEVL